MILEICGFHEIALIPHLVTNTSRRGRADEACACRKLKGNKALCKGEGTCRTLYLSTTRKNWNSWGRHFDVGLASPSKGLFPQLRAEGSFPLCSPPLIQRGEFLTSSAILNYSSS